MLTFDKIRDLERAEREYKQLQKLPDDIIEELKDYLHRKDKTSDPLEIENIKNTIKRLFELRERKTMELVLYSVRTGLPPENLTKGEEELFNIMVTQLKNFRENLFAELKKEAKEKKLIYKIRKNIPPFIGPDSKTYEFKENDIVDIKVLPKEINDLLLKEGVIEQVEE